MDDVEPVEAEILDGNAHELGDAGRHGVLELEAEAPATPDDEQVELGALMRSPEEAFARAGPQPPDDLGEGEAIPRPSADYFVQALDDAIKFLFGGAGQAPPDPFHRERADLADPDPGLLRQARSATFERERKPGAWLLTRQGDGDDGPGALVEHVVV